LRICGGRQDFGRGENKESEKNILSHLKEYFVGNEK